MPDWGTLTKAHWDSTDNQHIYMWKCSNSILTFKNFRLDGSLHDIKCNSASPKLLHVVNAPTTFNFRPGSISKLLTAAQHPAPCTQMDDYIQQIQIFNLLYKLAVSCRQCQQNMVFFNTVWHVTCPSNLKKLKVKSEKWTVPGPGISPTQMHFFFPLSSNLSVLETVW